MDQSKIYEKYLDRLRGRRAESPYYTQARREIRQLAPAYSDIRRTYEQRLRRQDLPEEVAMQYSIEQQKGWAEQLGGVYGRARTAEERRREQIVAKEEEIEFKRDIALEQEKERREEEAEAKRKAKAQSIWKVVGTVAGGVAGALIPGIGTIAAASLGLGLGGIVGAGQSSGWGSNMTMADIGALEASVGQIFSGLGSVAQTQKQAKMAEGVQQIMADLKAGIITLDEVDEYLRILYETGVYKSSSQGTSTGGANQQQQIKYEYSPIGQYGGQPYYNYDVRPKSWKMDEKYKRDPIFLSDDEAYV